MRLKADDDKLDQLHWSATSCLVGNTGQLHCWGVNENGASARSTTGGDWLLVEPVAGLREVAGFSGTSDMHCVWQADDAVIRRGDADNAGMILRLPYRLPYQEHTRGPV